MTRTYVGDRIRRLRDELGLQQNVLADQLGISASYLNQLERDQRPLTAPVLLKLIDTLGDRVVFLSEVDQVRLTGELQEVALDLDGTLTKAEITHLVSSQPDLGAVLVSIHRRYRDTADQLAALTDSVGARESLAAPTFMPYDMVRDFFYDITTTSARSTKPPKRSPSQPGCVPEPPTTASSPTSRRDMASTSWSRTKSRPLPTPQATIDTTTPNTEP